MKLKTFTQSIGLHGGGADEIFLSGFNVEKIVANLIKIDAGSVGQVFAGNALLQFFDPLTLIRHADSPKLFFGFFPPDAATTAHESISGSPLTVTGAGSGVNIGNVPGAVRYQQSWGSLNASNQAALIGGVNWLNFSEAGGTSWSWLGWVFWGGSTANIYIESNAAVTIFFAIALSTGGIVAISKAGIGGGSYTSAAIFPAGQWIYLGITYDGTNIRVYQNASLVAGPTAVARATTNSTDRLIMQQGASGQVTTAGVEVYSGVVLSADDMQRHMQYYNNDIINAGFVATAANIAQNSAATILFSNDVAPGFDAVSQTLRFPLSATNSIQTGGGIFLAQIDTWEREIL